MAEHGRKMTGFKWSAKSSAAALALAAGKTREAAAEEAVISESTVYRWLRDPTFADEVDRLTLLTAIASRAYRLRIANRVVAQMVKDGTEITTAKDLLDWLRYAREETTSSDLLEQFIASMGDR